MARTPSSTPEEMERILGPRGRLTVTKPNRGDVKKWLSAMRVGLPSLFIGGLSMPELAAAYNELDGSGIERLQKKYEEYKKTFGVEDGQEDQDSNEQEAAEAATHTHKVPATANTSTQGESKLIETLREVLGSQTVDAEQVRAIIDEKLKDWQSPIQLHKIQLIDVDGTIKDFAQTVHPQFPKLLRASQARMPDGHHPNIWLVGEASSGKTTAAKQLAKALGKEFYINGAITMAHEMLGFIDGNGRYHDTQFSQAFGLPAVYCFDEIDRSDNSALLPVNPHLANGSGAFPHGTLQRHQDSLFICTANTWGLGANSDYVGAAKLDAALRSRFPVRIEWNIDEDFERSISGNVDWCNRVQRARRKAREHSIKVLIDTRIVLAGGALIATGFTADEAAQMTYLADLTPAQRDQVGG